MFWKEPKINQRDCQRHEKSPLRKGYLKASQYACLFEDEILRPNKRKLRSSIVPLQQKKVNSEFARGSVSIF